MKKVEGGSFKGYDYSMTINAFELGSVLLQNQTLHNEAQLIATYKGYIHDQEKSIFVRNSFPSLIRFDRHKRTTRVKKIGN